MAKIKTTVLKYDGTRQDPADFPKIDVIKMFFFSFLLFVSIFCPPAFLKTPLSGVFSEVATFVGPRSATQPCPHQLRRSELGQGQGPIPKPRQGQDDREEVVGLWGGGRQRFNFKLTLTGPQEESCRGANFWRTQQMIIFC